MGEGEGVKGVEEVVVVKCSSVDLEALYIVACSVFRKEADSKVGGERREVWDWARRCVRTWDTSMEEGRVRPCVLVGAVGINRVELKVADVNEKGESTLVGLSDSYSSGSREGTRISLVKKDAR